MSKNAKGLHPAVEGLLNLYDLLHLVTLEPMTTRDLMARLGLQEESLRRLRRRADGHGLHLRRVAVERKGHEVEAWENPRWDWREVLEPEFERYGRGVE